MDSRISLALANKLRWLFEREDRFLTYPLGIGFDYRYLSFMEDLTVSGLSPQERLNNKADFARLMNCIPRDNPTYSPDADRMLWTVMKDVLVGADYAASGLTAAEEEQLRAAIDFLTEKVTEGGSTVLVYSPVVRRYYEHKTLYDAASMTYLDEKITVESTTGPEGDHLRAQWAAYREKQLRDAIDKAMQDWITLGAKTDVERQQAIQRQLEPKKYLNLSGQSYLNDLELSEIPDVTGNPIGFCTTFFSPADAFEKTTPWTRITLMWAEIDTLIKSAPAPLKAMFGAGPGTDDGIVSITLEYNDVPILRPWFHPEFFDSRSWKMADKSVVSNGATPRAGLIPAYVTSVLAVRSIAVTRKKAAVQRPIVLPIVGAKPLRELKFGLPPALDVQKLKADRAALDARLRIHCAARDARLLTSARMEAVRPAVERAVARPRATPRAIAAKPAAAIEPRAAMLDSLAALQPAQRKAFIAAKYRGTTIPSPKLVIPPRRPEPPPRTEEVVTEPYEFPGVAVLAFVCKRVPKAPNPDVALPWPE